MGEKGKIAIRNIRREANEKKKKKLKENSSEKPLTVVDFIRYKVGEGI